MAETTVTLLVFGGAAAAWIAWLIVSAIQARRRLAGVRLVECPETHAVAAVTLDRTPALMAGVIERPPDVHLASCSRWPERGRCDEPCLPLALDASSAVSDLVARWSADRRCASCGGELVEAAAVGHHVAVRSNGGVTREWTDINPEMLPETLRRSEGVCWNCHIAETFRRTHPELVTDR